MTSAPTPGDASAATLDYLPLFLDVHGRACVVAGGGAVARRKVALLLRAGARVAVWAPMLEPRLARWAQAGRVAHHAGPFAPFALDGAAVVIAATDDRAVNRQVAQEARRRGIPVNVVDDAAASTFIVPAIVERSPLVVAISSGGTAPVLARLVRARVERALTRGHGRLAALAGRFRARVRARLGEPRARNRFWEEVFQGPVAALALAGREREAEQALTLELEQAARRRVTGSVALVGAGPGDPELLTLRAARLLQHADAIVHDRLVPQDILELARRDAERIDVGKAVGRGGPTQAEINALLVRLARAGQRVVRLKGGDPFIFGRGGEEQQALAGAGIRCEVVPGITAAAGCAARLGIPLTHRDHAHAVVLATGHSRAGGTVALPRPARDQTLVVYMGLSRLAELCGELMRQGLDADTPAAVMQEGTTPHERFVLGTVSTLPGQVAQAGIRAPALLIVGAVAGLHSSKAHAAAAPGAAADAPALLEGAGSGQAAGGTLPRAKDRAEPAASR